MVLTESELSGGPVLLYTGLEISIEEANYAVQENAASNPVIRLQIEYEVLFHVLQTGNAPVEASQCRYSNWCEGHWRE